MTEHYYRVEATWHDDDGRGAGWAYTLLSESPEAAATWAKRRAGNRPNLEISVRLYDYVHVARPLSYYEPIGHERALMAQQNALAARGELR